MEIMLRFTCFPLFYYKEVNIDSHVACHAASRSTLFDLEPFREICMQFRGKYCSICSTPFLLTLLRILLKMVLDAFYFTYYTCLYIQIPVLQQNIHTICVSRVETNFGTSTELWHSLEQLQPIRGNQRTVIYDIFFFPSQK